MIKSYKYIAIHCSATSPNYDIGVEKIREWHTAKGWSDVGYHYVIKRDGTVEKGRADNMPGAHVEGYNSVSLGICLVGGVNTKLQPEDNFTPAQWASLTNLVRTLHTTYPTAKIQGHRDFPGVSKACPSFDVAKWLQSINLEA